MTDNTEKPSVQHEVDDPPTAGADLAGWLLEQIALDDRFLNTPFVTPGRWEAEREAKRRIIALVPAESAEVRTEQGYFEGFVGRDCGEHRTVGDYRAWCHDCGEWCYPDEPCVRCHGRSEVLRLLALPYADRDGYQERWKP